MIGIRDTEKASSLILTPQLHCILHTTDPDDGVAAAARAVLPFCQLLDLHLREEPGSDSEGATPPLPPKDHDC